MKNIEELKHYTGQLIQLRMRTIEEEYIGNLDDGEDRRETFLGFEDKFCVLENIYLHQMNPTSISLYGQNLKFIRGKQEGTDVLFPLEYSFCKSFMLRRFADNLYTLMDQIIIPGHDLLNVNKSNVSPLFDGCKNVVADHDRYSDEDAARMCNYPVLAKSGCIYNQERRAITGNLDKLLEYTKPLW
jgi:hypothetical protein